METILRIERILGRLGHGIAKGESSGLLRVIAAKVQAWKVRLKIQKRDVTRDDMTGCGGRF